VKTSLIVLCVLFSCATARVPHVPGDLPPTAANKEEEATYQAVLEHFTRSQGMYDNLDSRMFIRATAHTPTFAQARIRREAAFRALPNADLEKLLGEEEKRQTQSAEFFFAVHANDPKHDDFNRSNSIWRIALVLNGVERVPTKIERIGRVTTDMRSVYSYMESFWVGYRITFDGISLPNDKPFELKVASSVGQAKLEF
jgi:hypothetical protein